MAMMSPITVIPMSLNISWNKIISYEKTNFFVNLMSYKLKTKGIVITAEPKVPWPPYRLTLEVIIWEPAALCNKN